MFQMRLTDKSHDFDGVFHDGHIRFFPHRFLNELFGVISTDTPLKDEAVVSNQYPQAQQPSCEPARDAHRDPIGFVGRQNLVFRPADSSRLFYLFDNCSFQIG